MKVKDVFAILKREPANWDREFFVEVIPPDDVADDLVRVAEVEGGEPTSIEGEQGDPNLVEPRKFVLRVKEVTE